MEYSTEYANFSRNVGLNLVKNCRSGILTNFKENIGGKIQYQLKIVMNVCNFTNLVLHPFLVE